MGKLRYTFEFVEGEEAAKTFCANKNKQSSYYIRTKKPAHYTLWNHSDPQYANTYVCWYYY